MRPDFRQNFSTRERYHLMLHSRYQQNILRVKFSAAPKRKTNAEKRGFNWLYKIL